MSEELKSFWMKSEEVINAKTVCNEKYIYSVNPSPQPVQTRIKNVFLIPGNFAKKYKSNWRFSMFEIETDIGVYISSSGFPGNPHHQNNGIFSNGKLYSGGADVDWAHYENKIIDVVTGPPEANPWKWIYFIHKR